MYCLRCGTKNEENASYCKYCKTELKNSHYDQARYSYNYSQSGDTKSTYSAPMDHGQYYNYSYRYSNNGKNPTETTNNHQDQYYYSYNYSTNTIISGDEQYLYNYVGPSYQNIKNKKFSFSTLLFGPLYFLYRKLFYYALVWIFLLIITYYYIPEYFQIIYIAINIFLATKFSTIYLNKVEQSVDKIKHQSLERTSKELLDKCKKKGGTLIKPSAVIPILFILFSFAAFIPTIYDIYSTINKTSNINENEIEIQKPQEPQQSNEITIKNISFKIPDNFIAQGYNSDYSKTYIYQTETDYCRIGVYVNNYVSSYESDEEYIYDNIFIENTPPISYTSINNTTWTTIIYNPISTSTYYNYAHIYNNTGYLVNYEIIKDETSACSKKFSEFTNSLILK